VNTLPLWALGWAAQAILSLGFAGVCVCCMRDPHALRALHDHAERVERDLRFLRSPWSLRSALSTHVALVTGACLAVAVIGRGAALLIPLTAAAPALWLARARRARRARIEAQLDTWLVVLANALRATPSLGQALDESATRCGGPLGNELRIALNETRLGAPLDQALSALGERVQSPTLDATLITLRIARSSGGDLSATLDEAAASLREMARLDGVIRTKTAEGRAQSLLIALIPFPLCALLDVLSPSLLAPLWETARGHLVLAGALALWLAALLMARRITAVEV
jgi:tight adherence protein B